MRYAKGTISVSLNRDIPLLAEVRNSKFITHRQLFELMQAGRHESSRSSFNWRMKRLLQSNHVSICQGDFGAGAVVYRITRDGLIQLENHGEFAVVLNSATQHLPHPSQAQHALELNAIRLALVRANLLANWRSDVEIASSNTIAPGPLKKDYDAIVHVWNGGRMARFALEYERTLKSARQYEKVRMALENETQVGCILYLTSGFGIVLHLANELSGVPRRLAFATAPLFRHYLLDTPVILDAHQPEVKFKELLQGVF